MITVVNWQKKALWQTSAQTPMPAVQEVMSILIASIENLILVQWKLISGLANSIWAFSDGSSGKEN